MKTLKSITLALIITVASISISNAQGCDGPITTELDTIDATIASLQSNKSADDFAAQVEKLERKLKTTKNKIRTCEMRGRVPLDDLKKRLKDTNRAFAILNGKTPAVEQDQSIDFYSKNHFIHKMQICVDTYGSRKLKEEDKVFKRSEIEVLVNYKDDGSDYYNSNIARGQNYLKNVEDNLNKDSWVEKAKITIDNKAKSINEDVKKAYFNSFYNDLVYIRDVALPQNKNLQTIIAYLKPHL